MLCKLRRPLLACRMQSPYGAGRQLKEGNRRRQAEGLSVMSRGIEAVLCLLCCYLQVASVSKVKMHDRGRTHVYCRTAWTGEASTACRGRAATATSLTWKPSGEPSPGLLEQCRSAFRAYATSFCANAPCVVQRPCVNWRRCIDCHLSCHACLRANLLSSELNQPRQPGTSSLSTPSQASSLAAPAFPDTHMLRKAFPRCGKIAAPVWQLFCLQRQQVTHPQAHTPASTR